MISFGWGIFRSLKYPALAIWLAFCGMEAHADPLSGMPPVLHASGVTSAALTQPGSPDMPFTDPAATQAPAAAKPEPQPAPVKPKAKAGARLNVVVFGDSLGDGLWAGLYNVLRKDKRYAVVRQSKVATGFVRQDYFNWNKRVREIAETTQIDVAVIIIGTNDRQTIVEGRDRYALFDEKWAEIYSARVDAFTKVLQDTGALVYWVGLPVMRGGVFERDMVKINALFEARARANGVTFIPTHALAADDDGKYQAYGLDMKGRKRLLRTEDGIHFTMAGYLLMADAVGAYITRDVGDGIVDNGGAVAAAVSQEMAVTGTSAARSAEERRGGSEPTGNVSAAALGLKTQLSDEITIRPGRSDDWRWFGAIN